MKTLSSILREISDLFLPLIHIFTSFCFKTDYTVKGWILKLSSVIVFMNIVVGWICSPTKTGEAESTEDYERGSSSSFPQYTYLECENLLRQQQTAFMPKLPHEIRMVTLFKDVAHTVQLVVVSTQLLHNLQLWRLFFNSLLRSSISNKNLSVLWTP